MKLKDSFIFTELGEGSILVPTGNDENSIHGIIRLNETAAFIVNCLKKETSSDQIVNDLLREYEVTRTDAEKHVNALLEKLREVGAVEE